MRNSFMSYRIQNLCIYIFFIIGSCLSGVQTIFAQVTPSISVPNDTLGVSADITKKTATDTLENEKSYDIVDLFKQINPINNKNKRSEEHTSELQSRENLV